MTRGASLPLIDQEDFIIASLPLVHLIQPIPLNYWIFLLVIQPVVHMALNVIAYLAKWKDVPY